MLSEACDITLQIGQTTEQIANHYTGRFLQSLKRLNILPPLTQTVTGSMPAIIRYIQRLEEVGSAYATDKG